MPKAETNTRRVLARLEKDGWIIENGKEHDICRYSDHPGVLIVIPRHRDLSPGVARDVAKKADW